MVPPDPRWQQTAHHYRDYLLSSGSSKETVRTYTGGLSVFWRECARYEVTPYDVDRTFVRSWFADRKLIVSAQQQLKDLASLRHFYAFLKETRDRDDDPTVGIKVKRPKVLPTAPFQDEEIAALMQAASSERDRLIVLMLASTGLRISELASLTAECIDWRLGKVKVTGKGSKQREVTPAPEVLGRLRAYVGMFPQGPLWLSKRAGTQLSAQQLRKILYELGDRAGVEGVHPHRFRSSFATAFIDQHGDIQALQGVLGHSSIETTSRYSESSKMKRAHEQTRTLTLVSRLAG